MSTVLPTPRRPGTAGFSRFSPGMLALLRGLKRHNEREWFQPRKHEYERLVREPMVALVDRLAHEFESFAPELLASPRTSLFRIYRDTRFSADKSPYKTAIGAVFPNRTLPKTGGAGLYLEVAPEHVWIGGGMYMPSSPELHLVREHIVTHQATLERLISAAGFRRTFGEVSGDKLQRVPRGFPVDHPAGEWLRHRQFLAFVEKPAEFATSPGFFRSIVRVFRTLAPLVAFLNEPLVAAQSRGALQGGWKDTQ